MLRRALRSINVKVWPDGVYVERDGVIERADYHANLDGPRPVLHLSGRLGQQELAEAAVEGAGRILGEQASAGGLKLAPVVGRVNANG